MIKNGKYGGNTRTGLIFEGKVDLLTFLSNHKGYTVSDDNVFYNGEKGARISKKFLSNNSIILNIFRLLNLDYLFLFMIRRKFKCLEILH